MGFSIFCLPPAPSRIGTEVLKMESGIFDRGPSRRRSDYMTDYIFSVCHLHQAGMAPRYWKYIFISTTCILSRSGSKVFPCGWSFSPERTAMECTSIIDLFSLPMRRTMIDPAGKIRTGSDASRDASGRDRIWGFWTQHGDYGVQLGCEMF